MSLLTEYNSAGAAEVKLFRMLGTQYTFATIAPHCANPTPRCQPGGLRSTTVQCSAGVQSVYSLRCADTSAVECNMPCLSNASLDLQLSSSEPPPTFTWGVCLEETSLASLALVLVQVLVLALVKGKACQNEDCFTLDTSLSSLAMQWFRAWSRARLPVSPLRETGVALLCATSVSAWLVTEAELEQSAGRAELFRVSIKSCLL